MILLGSRNVHKLEEARAILAPLGVRVALAVALPGVEETGSTFLENAALKARTYADYLGAPVLADDSGLVVPALGGEPGIYSARYAGDEADPAANLRRLESRLREEGLGEPEAFFVCALALAIPGRILLQVEGRVDGRIVYPPRGAHGFGYDPVFFHPPSGCTFAELPPERKNAVSHRADALRKLAERIPEFAELL